MSTHLPDQAVFRSALPEDIDWEPFPAFPPSARLAVVVGQPSQPAPYVVRVKLPSGQRSRTRSSRGCEQQMSTSPSAGSSIGAGA
jgi:hypothetical protein